LVKFFVVLHPFSLIAIYLGFIVGTKKKLLSVSLSVQLSRVGTNDNALIIKYSSDGAVIWATGIGGTGGLAATNAKKAGVRESASVIVVLLVVNA